MIHSLFDYCDRVAGEEKRAFVDLEYEHRLCEALEMCVMGELPNGKKNLIINVPPRCFKTTFTSQGFVSWCLAEVAPDCEFILTSATAGQLRIQWRFIASCLANGTEHSTRKR